MRKRRKPKPAATSVVWSVLEEGGFLAIPRPRALSLARFQFVVCVANTLPEARAILTKDEYRELCEHQEEHEDPQGLDGDEKFDHPEGYDDGIWPGWPAQEALEWVPQSILKRFAEVVDSFHSGHSLTWRGQPAEIVAAFEAEGFSMRRDDDLCCTAAGHADSALEPARKMAAYIGTDFEADLPKGKVVMRPGKKSAGIAAYLKRHGHHCGAVITAYNPRSTQRDAKSNVAANKKLKLALLKVGATVRSARGYSRDGKWPEEPSWFASGIDATQALLFAKRFGQDAILYCPADGVAAILWAQLPLKKPQRGRGLFNQQIG